MRAATRKIKAILEKYPALQKAQSFLELALILPILLLIILGIIELSFMVSQYLDLLDLTREAARFASVRDPFDVVTPDQNCSTPDLFDFYYDTSCIFSPPAGSPNCFDTNYCNGLNPFIIVNPETDDVVVSVFSLSDKDGTYEVKQAWPAPNGYWALSDHDSDTVHNENWKKDCQGNVVKTEPYYTSASVTDRLNGSTDTPHSKGFVAVELYYCYNQVLKLPLFTSFVPDPLRLHAYTLMSLPAAAPTPTPNPSVSP